MRFSQHERYIVYPVYPVFMLYHRPGSCEHVHIILLAG